MPPNNDLNAGFAIIRIITLFALHSPHVRCDKADLGSILPCVPILHKVTAPLK